MRQFRRQVITLRADFCPVIAVKTLGQATHVVRLPRCSLIRDVGSLRHFAKCRRQRTIETAATRGVKTHSVGVCLSNVAHRLDFQQAG